MPHSGSSRRERWLMLACVLTSLMPLLVCLVLGVWRGHADAQAHNAERAQRILDGTARVIDHTIERLEGLHWSAASACEDDVIDAMVYGVYNSIYIREMGVFDPDLALLCTNFGRIYVKVYQDIKHSLPRTGIFYNVVKTIVMKERSVIVNLRFEHGGGVNALIDPAVFVDLVDATGARHAHSLTLRFSPGDTIHDFSNPAASAARFGLVSEKAHARLPVSIRITADDAEVWAAIRSTLPRHALAGLFLSLLAAWCLRLVWHRLNPPEHALRQALQRREFMPYFQPIINLDTGLCDGAEALMRWRHPDAGLIPPDSFIPIAERTGLIKPMTTLLIERICTQLGPFLRNRNLYVAVNLSRSHLDDQEIVDNLRAACQRYEVPPETFTFEITERGLPADLTQALATIDALKRLGCRIAIDDFGTGHNGLNVLQKLPADILKIDRSFIEPIGEDTPKAAVVDSIIDIGQRFKLSLVAEGVETELQHDHLVERRVDRAQGYFYAPPMEAADFVLFLERTARLGG